MIPGIIEAGGTEITLDVVPAVTILDFREGSFERGGHPIDLASILSRPELYVPGSGLVIPPEELMGAVEVIGQLKEDFLTMDWSVILHFRQQEYPNYSPLLLRITDSPVSTSTGVRLGVTFDMVDANNAYDYDGVTLRGQNNFDWIVDLPDGRIRLMSEDGTNLNYIGMTQTSTELSIASNGEVVNTDDVASDVDLLAARVFLGGEPFDDTVNSTFGYVIIEYLELQMTPLSAADLLAATVLPDSVPVSNTFIFPAAANLVLSSTAPIVPSNIELSPTVADLILSGTAPTVTIETVDSVNLSPASANLSLSGTAPTLALTTNADLSPSSANLALTGGTPAMVVSAFTSGQYMTSRGVMVHTTDTRQWITTGGYINEVDS